MPVPPRVRLTLLALAAALCLPASAQAAPVRGALIQLPGTLGCFSVDGGSPDGPGTCAPAPNVFPATDLLVSPDGRNVYEAQYGSGQGQAINAFSREPATGALTQLAGQDGCISIDGTDRDGTPDACADGRDIYGGEGKALAISPDGRFVYGASASGGVTVFARNADTGALTQLPGLLGCYTAGGDSDDDGPDTCTVAANLEDGLASLTMSADGRFLYSAYAGTNTDRIVAFARNGQSGALTPLPGAAGCLVAGGAPGCTTARTIGYGQTLAITPDGHHAYAPDYPNGVAILDRDPDTGVLTQPPGSAGCISADGTGVPSGSCKNVRGIDGPLDVQLSRDGSTLWVAANDGSGIATFHVNAGSGALIQLPGTEGCVSVDGSSEDGDGTCADGRGLGEPYTLTLSADGRTLYSAQSMGGLVAFAVDPATGALTQLPGKAGCVTETGAGSTGDLAEKPTTTCTDGRGLAGTYSVAVSPDDTSVYATNFNVAVGLIAFQRQVPPSCAPVTARTQGGVPVSIPLSCTDLNGDHLVLHALGTPAHGGISAVAGTSITYTPAADFSGTDRFTYTADDGAGDGAAATVTVTVDPAPVPPPRDRTAPAIALLGAPRAVRLVAGGLRVRVTVSEVCARVSARLLVPRSQARTAHLAGSTVVLASGARAITTPAGRVELVLTPTRTAQRALRRLSARSLRRLSAQLQVTASDLSGNVGTLTRQHLSLTR